MKDRLPRYPGRVKLNPVAGQVNTYDLVRADQPTEEGTAISKATLLSDATAAKLWPAGQVPANPVVDGALGRLEKATIYENNALKSLLGSLISIPTSQLSDRPWEAFSKLATGSYRASGAYGASSPNSLTFEFVPKLVLLLPGSNKTDSYKTMGIGVLMPRSASYAPYGMSLSPGAGWDTNTVAIVYTMVNGKTVYWYAGSDIKQINYTGWGTGVNSPGDVQYCAFG